MGRHLGWSSTTLRLTLLGHASDRRTTRPQLSDLEAAVQLGTRRLYLEASTSVSVHQGRTVEQANRVTIEQLLTIDPNCWPYMQQSEPDALLPDWFVFASSP